MRGRALRLFLVAVGACVAVLLLLQTVLPKEDGHYSGSSFMRLFSASPASLAGKAVTEEERRQYALWTEMGALLRQPTPAPEKRVSFAGMDMNDEVLQRMSHEYADHEDIVVALRDVRPTIPRGEA